MKSSWNDILEIIKKNKFTVHAILVNSNPVAVSKNALILVFKYEIHCSMASSFRNLIESAIRKKIGYPLELILLDEARWSMIKSEFLYEQNERLIEGDPLIEEAKKLFGSELILISDKE
jgi:DNA polymerase III subunit gamma/tau